MAFLDGLRLHEQAPGGEGEGGGEPEEGGHVGELDVEVEVVGYAEHEGAQDGGGASQQGGIKGRPGGFALAAGWWGAPARCGDGG